MGWSKKDFLTRFMKFNKLLTQHSTLTIQVSCSIIYCRMIEHYHIQGLSERMAVLKLLVLGTESTIGAKICGKVQ